MGAAASDNGRGSSMIHNPFIKICFCMLCNVWRFTASVAIDDQ